ncbi:MAG: SdrD B-like domain-containing protein [Pseudomonadota bacterium]
MKLRSCLLFAAIAALACAFLGAAGQTVAPTAFTELDPEAEIQDPEDAPDIATPEVEIDAEPEAMKTEPSQPQTPEAKTQPQPEPANDRTSEAQSDPEPESAPEPEPESKTAEDLVLTVPLDAISVEFEDVIVEGTQISVRAKQVDDDLRFYNLTDFAEVLNSRVEVHETLLGYYRAQDGTLMSIDMSDGKVRSNRTVLGRLPDFYVREAADPWISLNAVSVMTGTHISEDERGRSVLTLDDQLKPEYGLELWIDGVLVDTFDQEPRTIGSVLLVPLRPVVEAFGHELTVADGIVTVRRQQDQAIISLELATGLISTNTTPRGVAPDMPLAERDTLVLPFNAVESLTGTHIKLVPLTNRVEVTLDTRLNSAALPGLGIADEARNTPLTIESLTYQISDRGPLRTETRGYIGKYNLRGRLDTAGGLDTFATTQPGWASLDIASLDGWNATVGDYSPEFRELSGVSANRIRGASWRKQRDNGSIIAIAGGMPFTSSQTQQDGTVAVPQFGGFVAGGRLIDDVRRQDVGIAASLSENGESGAIIANGQKSFSFDRADRGIQSAFVAADLGAFTGAASGADVRLRGSLNYAATGQLGVTLGGSYDGAKFAAGVDRPNFDGVFDQRNGARTNFSVAATWRAEQPIGALHRLAFGARTLARHRGGAQPETATSHTLSANARIGAIGPTVSAVVQQTQSSQNGAGNTSIRLRGLQRFTLGTLTVSYNMSQGSDAARTEQLVATAQTLPFRKRFEKDVTVQVAPNAVLNWTELGTRLNAGASVIAESGRLFGPRLDVQARLSTFADFTAEQEAGSATRFLGALEARYRVAKNAVLTAVYSDDFAGRTNLSIGLRGTLTFNPPRVSRLPDEGKGVLNGRVFLDRNRDGIRQEDEPGIPGVQVMLIGTRIGLNTGTGGYFTIQNIREGLYAVTVNRQSLPLGYLVPEASQPSVTIGSGRRTDVDIPLILSGQVRGTVFIDDNGNGQVDAGERRLEGQWITLESKDGTRSFTSHTASFGQYGFESVDPGTYTLKTTISGHPVVQDITVDVDSPFVIAPIPIPAELGDKAGEDDLSGGVLGEP